MTTVYLWMPVSKLPLLYFEKSHIEDVEISLLSKHGAVSPADVIHDYKRKILSRGAEFMSELTKRRRR